jgi:amidase
MKPTWGRVSRHGIVELAASFDTVGPIARSARDVGALLTVMAGSDINDPTSSLQPVTDYAADLTLTQPPRIGVDWSQMAGFDEDTKTMMADVIRTLDGLGWPVIEVKLPALDRIVAAFGKMRGVETAIAHAETYPARADEYGPTLREMIDSGRRLSAVEYQTFVKQRLEFTGSLRRVFQGVEIVLMPSCGLGSPTQKTMRELGQDAAFYARLAAPTAPFNVSGNPAMCLPAGVTPRGTPLGIQFIGREFAERLLIQAGHAFQQVTDFHRGRPPL